VQKRYQDARHLLQQEWRRQDCIKSDIWVLQHKSRRDHLES
jgi:hypothetical protein